MILILYGDLLFCMKYFRESRYLALSITIDLSANRNDVSSSLILLNASVRTFSLSNAFVSILIFREALTNKDGSGGLSYDAMFRTMF